MEPTTQEKRAFLEAHIKQKAAESWTLTSVAKANKDAGLTDEAKRLADLAAAASRVQECLQKQLDELPA